MNVNFVLYSDKDGRTDGQNVSLYLKKVDLSFWHGICVKKGVTLRRTNQK